MAMRPSKLCFSLQSKHPRMEWALMLLPCCGGLCYYKLAAGHGNLQDQSRQQAEKLRTQEMPWVDSGCIKSPRCRSLLSKTRRFFWSGLDVWVCSWGTAQLESGNIIWGNAQGKSDRKKLGGGHGRKGELGKKNIMDR